jgi:hypothetical protein
MSHILKIILLFTMGLPFFFSAATLLAQSGGQTGSFQRMGFGPRGMAMGNAMTSATGDGVYGYYNPALTAQRSDRRQLDISSAIMQFDRNLNMLNAHFNLPPSAGIGLYLIHAGVRNIDGRTSSGYHTQMLSTNEFQIGTQFGMRFSDRVWSGVGLKFNMARFHEELNSSTAFGADIGVLIRLTDNITAAVTAQDLLATYQWHAGNLYGDDFNITTEHTFPVRLKAGLSYIPIDPLLISSEFEYRINHEPEPRLNINSTFLRLGVRYFIHERFTIRSGIRFIDMNTDSTTAVSAGFSLHLPLDQLSPSIDYTFVQEPNRITNFHVFALRLMI